MQRLVLCREERGVGRLLVRQAVFQAGELLALLLELRRRLLVLDPKLCGTGPERVLLLLLLDQLRGECDALRAQGGDARIRDKRHRGECQGNDAGDRELWIASAPQRDAHHDRSMGAWGAAREECWELRGAVPRR